MNKREARIHILNLQENHCDSCEHRRDINPKYCWTDCKVGIEMNELGVLLGGRIGTEQKKLRTTKEWDKICKKARALKKKGMTYVEIAKKFNTNTGHLSVQLKKRGLK
ncbi:zinc-finger domain-containing protein [Bacillus thuringiensis]|uniref:zinc-finger domain-containing protein n=1 Tax=Bacillus thuringiensis TaxID=1428 RepID=UPI0011A0E586|nr:zinc-finger domain-containing protein [Bacillus thuringiensis]